MSDFTSEQAATPRLPMPSTDWLLQELVNYANDNGTRTGITLHVPGAMVAGILIPVDQYIDEFAAQYRDGFKNQPEEAQHYFNLISGYKPTPEAYLEPPCLIHLKDAKVYSAGNLKAFQEVPLWRGRISDVAGFFLGILPDQSSVT